MIGQLLKDRRQALGLSQTEVARRAGSSQRQVSRLENGEELTMPRRDTLERFGAVLGITLPEFYQAAGMIEVEGPVPPAPLPPGIALLMREMVRQYPELEGQFAERREDEDFAAQVRTLARVLGFTAREWLEEPED